MKNFKTGDIVKCIATEGIEGESENYAKKAKLRKGSKYTVKRSSDNYWSKGIQTVVLEEKDYDHLSSNFELIK